MTLFFSPAKINLFFEILKKRSDGYTEIVSLIRAIDLSDKIYISLSDSSQFTLDSPFDLPTDETNLILRAVHLFQKKTRQQFFCKIHLEKKIPPGAGLGGGSSNAATTLWALNQLTRSNFPISTLMQWGSELGMDIPFFFSEGFALCTQRGECVQNIFSSQSLTATLAIPKFHISTRSVYQAIDFETVLKKNSKRILKNMHLVSSYFNHLEIPAFSLNPFLKVIKQKLLDCGFDQVVMTGSGSAFVCYGTASTQVPENISFYPIQDYTRESTKWYGENKIHET